MELLSTPHGRLGKFRKVAFRIVHENFQLHTVDQEPFEGYRIDAKLMWYFQLHTVDQEPEKRF